MPFYTETERRAAAAYGWLSSRLPVVVSEFGLRSGISIAVHRDGERVADLAHAVVTEPSEAFDEDSDGHVLDGVEVRDRAERYRIVIGIEDDLARQPADIGCARCDEGTPKPWYRSIPG